MAMDLGKSNRSILYIACRHDCGHCVQAATPLSEPLSLSKIGELIMRHFKGLDTAAYICFASVYREFKDMNE